jgi:autotransporter-associated beta strand protein
MNHSPFRSSGLFEGCLLLLSSPAALSQYTWLGTITGETDLGKRYSIFNGDAVSLFQEANWENSANPGNPPSANSINNSSEAISGINAPIQILNGGVAGGTNGAGTSTAHLRSNGHAITVAGQGSGLKMSADITLRAMIQNDGSPGGDRSPLNISNGAFVHAERLQDIAVTIGGSGSRLFIASTSPDHAGLENSTIALSGLDENSPEIHFTSNTLESILPALASITINGAPLSYGTDPFRIEAGDNVLLTARDNYTFANFKQLDAQGTTSPAGISLRAISPVSATYWDTNGTSAGGGIADEFLGTLADGSWDPATAYWTQDITGLAAPAAWTEGNIAAFAAGDDVDLALINVVGTRTVSGILVESGIIDLEGGTIQFTGGKLHIGNGARLNLGSQLAGTPRLGIERGSSLDLEGELTTAGLTGDGELLFFEGDSLSIDSAVDQRFAGVVSGGGTLVKTGSGNFQLTRPQNLTGSLTIENGTLTLPKDQGNTANLNSTSIIEIRNGATWHVAASPVTLGTAQTLSGSGTIAAADRVTWTQPAGNNYAAQTPIFTDGLTVLGTIEPGDAGIGELTVSSGTVSLGATSLLKIQIDDSATPRNDTLVVAGTLKIQSGAAIEFQHSGQPTAAVYELVRYSGTPPAVTLAATNLPNGYLLDHAYGGNTIALVEEGVVLTGFEAWAAANGIDGAGFDEDSGNTGISNGTAYALGLDPLDPSAISSLPGLAPVFATDFTGAATATLVDWNLAGVTSAGIANLASFQPLPASTASLATHLTVTPLSSGLSAPAMGGLAWVIPAPNGELNLARWDFPGDNPAINGNGNGNPNNWLQFRLQADPGHAFQLGKMTVSAWRNGAGAPASWGFGVSSDSGASWTDFGSRHTETASGTGVFNLVDFIDETTGTDLLLRFYATGPTGGTGNLHINQLSITGKVAPLVPGSEYIWHLPKGTEAAADPKIGYFFEISDTLESWTKVAPTAQDDSSFRYSLPVAGPRSFLRARIEKLP